MILSIYCLLFSLITAYESIFIFVLYSPNTSIDLVEDLKANLTGTVNLEEEEFFCIFFNEIAQESDFDEIFAGNQDFLVVDATFDVYLSRIIHEYTETHEIVNLLLNSDGELQGRWQFSLHNSLAQHLEAAESYIDYLGWDKLALISSKSSKSVRLASEYEKRQILKVFIRVSVSDTIIENSLQNLVGKIIKAQGVQMFLLLGEGRFYDELLYWLKIKKVYKQGAGVLIGSRGIYGTAENGLIYYVEKGLEHAASESEYEMLAIKQFTDLIYDHAQNLTQLYHNSVINSAAIRNLFEINTYQHTKLPVFSIVNLDDSQRVVKGRIDHNEIIFNPNSTMIYPGDTLVQPRQYKAEIRVSIAGGNTEPNGLPKNLFNSNNFLGSLYAQWYTNNGTAGLLDNFYINQHVTDCGTLTYNFTYYFNCMEPQKNELGVAFLSPSFGGSAVGYVSVFRAMSLPIPHCGAGTRTAALSNTTNFPEYVRIMTTSSYFAVTIARSLSYFG